MQAAGEVVGRTLQAVKAAAKPAVSTLDSRDAEACIREAGARQPSSATRASGLHLRP